MGARIDPSVGSSSFGKNEWKAGWTVVLAAFFGVGTVGIQNHALGVLIKPLSETFDWTRAQISLAVVILSIGTLTLSPVVGSIVDRFGARRVALIGLPLYALVLAAIGLNHGELAVFYLMFALVAAVAPAVGPLTWSLGVASRFHRSRGLALGISMAGIAAMGAIAPLLTQLALERVGIDFVWAVLGVFALVVGFPLALLFFFDANDLRGKERRESGTRLTTAKHAADTGHAGLDFTESLRSRRFWQLGGAIMIAAAVCGMFSVHLVAMITDRGMGAREAAIIAGAMSPATLVGRILGGYLLDRFFAPFVAGATLLLPMGACLLMLLPGMSVPFGIAVAVMVGLALGTEGDTVAYLAARYFGLKSYGKIYGLLFGLYGMGFGAGSFAGGISYQATASYASACLGFVVALPVAVAMLATLGRYPTFERDSATDHAKPWEPQHAQ
jgi:MFS family permease